MLLSARSRCPLLDTKTDVGTLHLTSSNACAQIMLGQFHDDAVRSHLRTQLTALQPVEVVLPKDELSSITARVLRVGLRQARENRLRGKEGVWSAEKAIQVGQATMGRTFAMCQAAHSCDGCIMRPYGTDIFYMSINQTISA